MAGGINIQEKYGEMFEKEVKEIKYKEDDKNKKNSSGNNTQEDPMLEELKNSQIVNEEEPPEDMPTLESSPEEEINILKEEETNNVKPENLPKEEYNILNKEGIKKNEHKNIPKEEQKEKQNNRKKTNIVKPIQNEANIQGKAISEAAVEKIKKIPEVYIIMHETEPKSENLSQQAARSKKASENTQLLSEMVSGQLCRQDNGDRIKLSKPIFKIGKSPKFADYVIQGNTAISRKHVELITRDGRCYVRDKNSTNGTFIDGIQLPPETEMQIKEGQTLTVADVSFVFKIN